MKGIDIKNKRKSLNLTQEELGKLIGVSKNTILNYEKGGVIPDSKITILNKMLFNIDKSSNVNEDSEVYHNQIELTYDPIEDLRQVIYYLKDTVKAKDDLIEILKEKINTLDKDNDSSKVS